ncbi:hypothetical protein SASPL_135192 [Salvia splendens]|uniref:Uncharacterized protein n=1 Tax=Salvia splendens TaxID=180675 RepID=A0A8X8ZFJ9_SALSN|nr:hypothetical protein SASPL_135192 [Salvia splendens]
MQTLLRVFLSLSIFSSSALPPLSLPERNFLGRDDTAMPWLLLYNLLMDNQFFNEGLCYECTKSSSMENVEEAADVQNVEEEAAGEKTTSVPAERWGQTLILSATTEDEKYTHAAKRGKRLEAARKKGKPAQGFEDVEEVSHANLQQFNRCPTFMQFLDLCFLVEYD